MGFTTPCFIRRNTPELQKQLQALGYELSDYLHRDILFTSGKVIVSFSANIGDSIDAIDCGENEDLFLAIAALRDDTSDNQYWVFDEDFDKWKKGDFVIGRFGRCSCYCHVATVEELIEHFK